MAFPFNVIRWWLTAVIERSGNWSFILNAYSYLTYVCLCAKLMTGTPAFVQISLNEAQNLKPVIKILATYVSIFQEQGFVLIVR